MLLRHTLVVCFAGIVALGALLFTFSVALTMWGDWHDEWSGYNASTRLGDGSCTIAVVPLHGTIAGYNAAEESYVTPAAIRQTLAQAVYEPGIYGVLLDIDSPGGTPAAAEAIRESISAASVPLSILAQIGDYGTSGAYLAALGADAIHASPYADVGGIGITMSYLSYAEQHASSGATFESLATAPLKDYGNPDKPLTDAERERILSDLKVMHDQFVATVARERGISIEAAAALADGASLPGQRALEAKLVDGVGGRAEARAWFARDLGIAEEDVIFCDE